MPPNTNGALNAKPVAITVASRRRRSPLPLKAVTCPEMMSATRKANGGVITAVHRSLGRTLKAVKMHTNTNTMPVMMVSRRLMIMSMMAATVVAPVIVSAT